MICAMKTYFQLVANKIEEMPIWILLYSNYAFLHIIYEIEKNAHIYYG